MRIVNFYCDHCGKKIKIEGDVNLVEIDFTYDCKLLTHLCNDCVEDLKKFISNVDIKEVVNEEKEG